MLPLLSTRMPIETGTSSRRKSLIGCSTLSSYTLKADFGMLVISFPVLVEDAYVKRDFPDFRVEDGDFVLCADRHGRQSGRQQAPRQPLLLRGCNISGTVPCPQRRQILNLHQFHFHFSVLAVMSGILRAVAEHVLVAELQADLGGHVRQIRQILDREIAVRRSVPPDR